MSAHLDSTFGAAFVGMVVAAVLYGVSCVQAFYYFSNQNDRWYTKLIVTVVMICDTVHQALIAHAIYTYTITGWGDPAQLGVLLWSLIAEIIFVAIPALVVQGVLTMRIWLLSKNIYLTVIPATLAVGGFATFLISTVKALSYKYMTELVKTKDLTTAITSLGAATDIVITAILCTLLHNSRTGYHKSEVIINRLIVFVVNTGLMTSLCALGALIAVLAAGNTFTYVALLFCLGRLYTNTLLATLNARKIIGNVDEAGSTGVSFSLQDFHKNGSDQTQNISIQIDTTTQKYSSGNDQKLEQKPKSPYDDESTKVSY